MNIDCLSACVQAESLVDFVHEDVAVPLEQVQGLAGLDHEQMIAKIFFIDTFNKTIDRHAPKREIRMKNRFNPWVSAEITHQIRDRESGWKRLKKTKLSEDWIHFRQKHNKCLK